MNAKDKLLKKPTSLVGMNSANIKDFLNQYSLQIAQALPRHLKIERIIQVATTLISMNPQLKECSASSLVGSLMQMSILGFEPIPSLGQCYLIPRRNKQTGQIEAQFQLGYRGMLELARRSNKIKNIWSNVVYQGDKFHVELGLRPDIKHIPNYNNRGEITHAYACVEFTDGTFVFEVMTAEEIMKAKAKSESKDSAYSPWNNFEPDMYRKTVSKKLFKWLPYSIETAIAADEAIIKHDDFDNGTLDINRVQANYEVEAKEVQELKEPEVLEPQEVAAVPEAITEPSLPKPDPTKQSSIAFEKKK